HRGAQGAVVAVAGVDPEGGGEVAGAGAVAGAGVRVDGAAGGAPLLRAGAGGALAAAHSRGAGVLGGDVFVHSGLGSAAAHPAARAGPEAGEHRRAAGGAGDDVRAAVRVAGTPRMTVRRLRDWYAHPRYYEAIFGVDTAREMDFVLALSRRYGTGGELLLEPACGAGRLIEEGARRGLRMVGYDASEVMLAHARRRL